MTRMGRSKPFNRSSRSNCFPEFTTWNSLEHMEQLEPAAGDIALPSVRKRYSSIPIKALMPS
jgi:hypothetical protein